MNDDIKKAISELLLEWAKPQTVFTLMFYGLYCFMTVVYKDALPTNLDEVVRMLLVFWFGTKVAKTQGGK